MYSRPVRFEKTNLYGCGPQGHDDVYTVDEFLEHVKCGSFIDYDGHGYPVKNKMYDPGIMVQPSTIDVIPDDATHIVWLNR